MSYKNILLAVDTNDEADQVFRAAIKMMDGSDTSISLVTVITPIASFYVEVYAALGDTQKLESEAMANAHEWLSTRSAQHSIDPKASEVILGSPATEIKRMAQKMNADLIVLGTHGQHGLGLMLGSTANAVLHGAQCDVLAVRVKDGG